MPSAFIIRQTLIKRTARVMQLEGLFEIPPTQRSEVVWNVSLPLEQRDWNIGLIVGASGSGKTTVARELFGADIVNGYDWPADKSVVDGFPAELSIKEITALLSSVGFSTPPAWLRPFHVLSNGEQFRVTVARGLAEGRTLTVIDEFTSVVDRTVAQIGSAAVQKTVRRRKQKLIAVSCHYDILDWLQPDWVYEPATGEFQWRELQRRPELTLEIARVHCTAWQLFKHYHYLDTNIHQAAQCFCAFIDGRPVAFTGVLSFPHAVRPGWREHRTVCLPDFQGVGIGNALSEYIASLFAAKGVPYRSTTSNPAMIWHRAKSKIWKMTSAPKKNLPGNRTTRPLAGLDRTHARNRLVAAFEYAGQKRTIEARAMGVLA